MSRSSFSRRRLLQALGLSAMSAPLWRPGRAFAGGDGLARRVIFFYFPDGVAGPSQDGEASLWHPTGGEHDFALPHQLEALEAWRDRCVFFRGLSMGGTDSGSHPGGAKKLLTAVDHGGGQSIDQYLAHTAGADMPWRHLYLGAQANANGAGGDKHIVYPTAGQTIPPEDNPRRAFELLFGTSASAAAGGSEGRSEDDVRASVIDAVLEDVQTLRSRLGSVEAAKLDLHLEALREVEQRTSGELAPDPEDTPAGEATCGDPWVDTAGFADSQLYEAERFPAILDAQLDVAVLAMACGLTKVATIQASHHTSELIMSRFADSEMHDPGYDMRSHQASHYGPRHDWNHREFADFVKQRRWWVDRFARLLARLDATPEGDGTMLDHSVVVLCTEVCDGNTHLHDDMPFVVAGGGGGRIRTGRLLDVGNRRHGDLWAAVAEAMGEPVGGWGDGSAGPLWELLQ